MARQVNERSRARLTVNFLDEDGAPAVPTSVSYQIHEESTGAEIRGATAVAPASTVLITLDSNDNSIHTSGRRESHRVTISATYGVNDESHEEFIYEVIALKHVA